MHGVLWHVGWNLCVWLCKKTMTRNWLSRPSEPTSPKRDLQKQARFTFKLSLRRRTLVLSEAMSHSSERGLPKRDRMESLTCRYSFSSGEGVSLLGEGWWWRIDPNQDEGLTPTNQKKWEIFWFANMFVLKTIYKKKIEKVCSEIFF